MYMLFVAIRFTHEIDIFCFSFFKTCIQENYTVNFITEKMKKNKIQAVIQRRTK